MKTEEVTLDNMAQKMIEALPELKTAYDKEVAAWTKSQGAHVLFSFVLFDSLKPLLKVEEVDALLVQKIFAFVELLAKHPDEKVQEVVYFSVCENICADEIVLQKAQHFMGKKTREFCELIIKMQKQN